MLNIRIFSFLIMILTLSQITAWSEAPEFKAHIIDQPEWYTSVHQVALADLDNDGDLDFTIGNVHQKPNLYWYEYQAPNQWKVHYIDSDEAYYGGTCVIDANKDMWPDIVTACWLYLNPGENGEWERHNIGTPDDKVHDMQAVDMNLDGQLDILVNTDRAGDGLAWYEAPADPTKKWIKHVIGGDYTVHGAVYPQAVGDLDGDGDLDVAAAQAWFENISPNGEGLKWKKRNAAFLGFKGRYGVAVRTAVRDIDFDGDMDIVQSECDHDGPVGIAWMENDGKGNFTRHWIQERVAEDYHTLDVIDYDNDGDWDILTGSGPLAKVDKRYTLLYENLASKNGKPVSTDNWQRHEIYPKAGESQTCHEAIAGDVDKDGDIDIITKPWDKKDPGPFVYLENQHGKPGQGLKEWTYIQVDDNRGKWGDDNDPAYMKYVGLVMGDVTSDGKKDIISGRYVYQNPGGDLTKEWKRIEFDENVDAMLLYDVDGDEYADIIAQDYPNVYWLEAKDKEGQTWKMTKVGDAPSSPHGNGQGHAFADLVAGSKKELVLTTGDGVFYWQIADDPTQPWKRFHISPKADEQGLACGDLDGDGDIDVVTGLKADHLTVLWFENPGDAAGEWKMHTVGAASNEAQSSWWGADRIEIADIDADGRNDIVVSEEDPGDKGVTANVWWFKPRANPKEPWLKIHLLDAYSNNNLDLADMDGDGDTDIITQEHKGVERLFILENRTRGGQWTTHVVDIGKEGHNASKAADLDGDGDMEIVSMAWDDYQYLHLWRNDN